MKKQALTPEEKEKKRGRLKMLGHFLKGSRAQFLVGILAYGIISLCDMLNPQIIRAAVDNAIGGQPSSFGPAVTSLVDRIGGFDYLGKHMWIMALAVIAVSLLRTLGQYLFRLYNTKGAETLTKNMRDSLYEQIARLPFQWHMQNHTGDIIQRCTSDIDMVRNFISEQMTGLFRVVFLLVLSMVFMLSMNPLLTLIALIPMPVMVWYSFRFHRDIGSGFAECDENEGKLSAMAQENLTGVRVVRAFGREQYERERFHKHNEYYTGLWSHLAAVMSRFWCTSDVISGLQIMLVIVFGAVFCLNGRMTGGEYIAFISYNSLLVWPLRQMGRMISEMSKAGVSIDRIYYIMNTPREQDAPGAAPKKLKGDIAFEHVSFAYEGAPEILHDISFEIKAGSTLGILGGTGSGKSTLMLLLDRMYDLEPEQGRITIDGTDIRNITRESLRDQVGIVLQEPFLFSRTLAENIAITEKTADPEAIREAARIACLDETVQGFAKGYDTFVGERGVTLSGGQKQRAAIARTLMKKTPIMIFDDSLSAVDTETDAKIRKALEARFGSASIILISHRITTLSKADKVLVLDHGRVAEFGTPEELSRSGGLYQRINEIQSGSAEEVCA